MHISVLEGYSTHINLKIFLLFQNNLIDAVIHRQIIHIFVQSILCLVLMKSLRPGLMEKVVLVTAMAYLCVGHAYRLIYDYGGYTLDVTGYDADSFKLY